MEEEEPVLIMASLQYSEMREAFTLNEIKTKIWPQQQQQQQNFPLAHSFFCFNAEELTTQKELYMAF